MYSAQNIQPDLDPVVFEKVCNETLESLYEYFEELIDQSSNLKGADVTFSDGVLTVALGPNYGTYVINRQTPNKQIWLSSPTSGPKRYDLILDNGGYWIYKHDGVTLHKLLQQEISKISSNADFKTCTHALV
ncbi:jg4636 [Pararge aegeria aegeria]|uniref:ferroxidase n=2 Tax=Pararge aegeria TaxID=116150 RepID=A0A8S4RKT5_9NEOP|nr:jg4636 [Pararge aegeria aegeria]